MNERKKGKGSRPCRWWRGLPLAVAAVLFALTLGGCGTLGGMFTEGEPTYVLADSASVPPGAPSIPTVLEVKDADGTPTGRVYVVTPEETLPPEAPRVPIASAPQESGGWMTAISGMLAGTPAGPFAPVIGLLAAKLFATKRGRQHGVTAAKAAAKLDLGTAMKAVIASDGWLHSEAAKPVAPAPKSA
jgi:hypothetical protein